MKSIYPAFFALLILGCSTAEREKSFFKTLADQETVALVLSKYRLKGVPQEISQLTNTKRLYIISDSSGFTVYPPLGQLPNFYSDTTLSEKLPDEITRLTNLTSLALFKLNLTTLPDDFGNLSNLDTLNLSFNRLVIANEIPKIKKLKKLRFLGLVGNVVDSTDVENLKKDNPKLIIETWF